MFREIRRSERITEKSAKERELDYLYGQLFDCRMGSEEWNQIRTRIDELEGQTMVNAFDPDARI